MREIIKKKPDTGKLRVALYTRGAGILLFAAWNFLRFFIISFGTDTIPAEQLDLSGFALFAFDFISGGIDAALRAYVGRSAISLSRGGRLHRFSLFLAGYFAAVTTALYLMYFAVYGFTDLSLTFILEAGPDIAVIVLNIQVIVYSRRLVRTEA